MGRLVQQPKPAQKGPPCILESESAALGCALRDKEFAEQLVSELKTEDFYSGQNQAVFNAIRKLSEDGLIANPVSVAERAGCQRGVVEGLVTDSDGVSPEAAKGILSDIRRVSSLRTVFEACSNAASSVHKDAKLEEVVEALERSLYKGGDNSAEAADGSEVLGKVVDDFLVRTASGGGTEISTGILALDRALVGLRPGKMGVIAARPSMGKTALASTIRRAVLAQGYGVIEFNLEMSKEELLERELAFQAQLDLGKILRAKGVSEDELSRVNSARGNLFPGRWFVDDSTYGIAGARRKARILAGRMARGGIKVGCVIFDYIQLADAAEGEERTQSVAKVSRGLKMLSKELGCTVLALSQLNRSCEYREDRRPIMSDLRESGAIEQDADWIGFVYREHVYDPSYPAEDTEFIIRKQRSGPIGTIRLKYIPKLVSFTDKPKPSVESNPDG